MERLRNWHGCPACAPLFRKAITPFASASPATHRPSASLEKKTKDRYQTAAELLVAVKKALQAA
jgi:hypothetical protein